MKNNLFTRTLGALALTGLGLVTLLGVGCATAPQIVTLDSKSGKSAFYSDGSIFEDGYFFESNEAKENITRAIGIISKKIGVIKRRENSYALSRENIISSDLDPAICKEAYGKASKNDIFITLAESKEFLKKVYEEYSLKL